MSRNTIYKMSKITIETNNSVSTHRMNSYFDDIRLINMPLLESMLTMRTIFYLFVTAKDWLYKIQGKRVPARE